MMRIKTKMTSPNLEAEALPAGQDASQRQDDCEMIFKTKLSEKPKLAGTVLNQGKSTKHLHLHRQIQQGSIGSGDTGS